MSKKEIFGWSMYDFAETIFSSLFITLFFPLFVILKGGNAFHVGLVMSVSMLIAGLTVPFLGAVADLTHRKKLLLVVSTLICCIFTFFTGFFGLIAVLSLGLLANLFHHASLDVYDALLVNISSKKNRGRISGLGTAVGYAGAIFAIAAAYGIGRFYGYESISGIRIIFMFTALAYFGFALLTFIMIKESTKTKIRVQHLKSAFRRVIYTIRSIKKFKSVWLFLLASFLYVDGANTAIVFLYLYARDQIGLTIVQFFPIYIIMAMAAGCGALISGKITDKVGHKKTLTYILFLWIIVIFMLYLKANYTTFILAGIFGGALLGAIWTITRPLLICLAPKDKIAELLGYQGLTEKFSGVIGPFLFGTIAVAVGFREALLVVIALFFSGWAVLRYVKI